MEDSRGNLTIHTYTHPHTTQKHACMHKHTSPMQHMCMTVFIVWQCTNLSVNVLVHGLQSGRGAVRTTRETYTHTHTHSHTYTHAHVLTHTRGPSSYLDRLKGISSCCMSMRDVAAGCEASASRAMSSSSAISGKLVLGVVPVEELVSFAGQAMAEYVPSYVQYDAEIWLVWI